jgi:hypothetical protein
LRPILKSYRGVRLLGVPDAHLVMMKGRHGNLPHAVQHSMSACALVTGASQRGFRHT